MKCKDCQDRHTGCHSTCTDYIEWKKARDEELEAIRERREMSV